MAGRNFFRCVKKVFGLVAVSLFLSVGIPTQAQAADVVTTVKDADGWKPFLQMPWTGDSLMCVAESLKRLKELCPDRVTSELLDLIQTQT